MKPSQVTMQQIADECGVSIMTVSRALSPRHKDKLRPQTLELVLKTVKKYGFLSNPAASRLKRHKLDTISLLIGARALAVSTTNPDFDTHYETTSWGMVKNTLLAAREYNYDIKIETALNDDEELIPHLNPRITDGAIINSTYKNEKVIEHLKKNQLPFIVINTSITEKVSPGANIIIDISPGLREAFECLYGKGHRKIGFIGTERQLTSRVEESLYKKFFAEKAILDENLFYETPDIMTLRRLLESFKGKFPFTALFCYNDSCADQTVKELRYMGIRVPEDVAVCGFDGNPVYQAESIKLSTVETSYKDVFSKAVEILIEMIEKKNSHHELPLTIPARFMKGKTT